MTIDRTLGRNSATLAVAVIASLSVGAVSAASAATFTAHDGASLATAVQSADSQPGSSTIDLSSGVYAPDETLTIDHDLTIAGPLATGLKIVGSAVTPAGSNLFVVSADAQATFVNLTVTTAGAVGGDAALDVLGALDLENSTLAGNDGPDLTVESGGSATVRNSTLSDGLGAGLVDDGTATLINATVADNAVEGVDDSVGTLSLVNTIVADNGSPDCSAPATSSDHSLDSDGSCGVGALSHVNPLLGPLLASNGGPTPTHAVGAGSPAINGGDPSRCPSVDQRHYARGAGHCDIGAYEAGAQPSVASGSGGSGGSAGSGGSGASASGGTGGSGGGSAKTPGPTGGGSSPRVVEGVSGHGSLRGAERSRITFTVRALVAKPHGSLTYHDATGRVWLKSLSIASVKIDGARGTATIKGAGLDLLRGRHVSFTAVLTNHAGVRSLGLRLSSGYAGGGRLVSGAITLTGTADQPVRRSVHDLPRGY
jgi:uncharacterized membrane protein YgcG